MKKFLALLLAAMMCAAMVPAFADGEFAGETVTPPSVRTI